MLFIRVSRSEAGGWGGAGGGPSGCNLRFLLTNILGFEVAIIVGTSRRWYGWLDGGLGKNEHLSYWATQRIVRL
jgi:hypothetical protein